MQVAINPILYHSAQLYAEKQGLNLTTVIENYLSQLVSHKDVAKNDEVPDVVLSLLGAGAPIEENDLNARKAYYKYIEEKYK